MCSRFDPHSDGRVSRETVEQLHVQLMTDEEYMAGANKHWDQVMAESE